MSVFTALALALVLAAVIMVVVAVTRAATRGRQEPPPAPLALERSTGPVSVLPARPERRTEPPKPAEPPRARQALQALQAPEPAEATESPEPPAPETRRSVIPPAVTEALAAEPGIASEAAPEVDVEVEVEVEAAPAPSLRPEPVAAPVVAASTPAPRPAPAPAATPVVVAAVAVVAPVDRASIEADDPERKKARKLARLFVSEIKLYNEKLVTEGRAAGDLYARLKDSIDQSLVAFERRVPEAVRAEFDYMHDELVRQLAEGNASKLGAQYARLRRG